MIALPRKSSDSAQVPGPTRMTSPSLEDVIASVIDSCAPGTSMTAPWVNELAIIVQRNTERRFITCSIESGFPGGNPAFPIIAIIRFDSSMQSVSGHATADVVDFSLITRATVLDRHF